MSLPGLPVGVSGDAVVGGVPVAISQTANPAGVNTSFGDVATYANQAIGEAASDRTVCCLVGAEDADDIVSVHVDYGSGDALMSAGTRYEEGILQAQFFYLAAPTGTTATFKVTYAGGVSGSANHISVYRVTGASLPPTLGGDQSSDMDADDPLTTGEITIPANGGFLAVAACANDAVAKTWANAGEDIDADVGVVRYTTAIRTDAGTVTITCTGTTSGEDGALAYAIFAPAA